MTNIGIIKLAALLFLIAILLSVFFFKETNSPLPTSTSVGSAITTHTIGSVVSHGIIRIPSSPSPIVRGAFICPQLAARINAPDGSGQEDVQTLNAIIRLYFRTLRNRQGPPIGDDMDLARAISGHNPAHKILLPAGHPALSADGHIRDRWGTPYFIHPLGYGSFEIRSAGPDRKMFNGDDLIDSPPVGEGRTEIPDSVPTD